MGRCGVNLDIIAQRIRDAGIDWEQAHSLEDEMMRQVLDAIATDKTAGMTPKELASKALHVLAEFEGDPRWCA